MTDRELTDETIELGTASEVTRGTAVIDNDVGGQPLRFLAGIADD
ncbi:MAG: benenodin family lasso peptide [Novosphingobium sp.]|nr:benenodin family lasso peptide [Novosphingobium sp.]